MFTFHALTLVALTSQLTYPTNGMNLGGGEEDNINFKSHTETNFDFPFTLTYELSDDTNHTVLSDLLTKCGILGGTKEDITINYKIVVRTFFICCLGR